MGTRSFKKSRVKHLFLFGRWLLLLGGVISLFHEDFLDEAPVNLIYVWDGLKKSKISTKEESLHSAFAHTWFISQNVFLYCASEGLATVVRLWFDKAALEKKMRLRPEQYATLVQSVGYPPKTS